MKENKRINGANISAENATIMFKNPTVRLIDVFPDFIACLIIAYLLKAPSDRAPYFSEARVWFIRYGISSVAKLPAFYILTMVRGSNVSDYDISALLTFSFAVIDAILLTLAIKNLFSALTYLGERSELGSVISPFTVSKKNPALTMTPDGLLRLTLIFTYFKLAAGSLPEMLLLSGTVDTGAYGSYITFYSVYPYVIILAVLATFIFGIISTGRFLSYLRAIKDDSDFYAAVDSLVPDCGWDELHASVRKKEISFSFRLIPVAAAFSLIVRFDNVQEINLVPLFALGLILIYVYLRVSGERKIKSPVLLSGCIFVLTSIIYQIVESSFLSKYGYFTLVGSNSARAEYVPTLITAAVCTLSFCAFAVLFAIFVYRFISAHLLSKLNQDGRAEIMSGYAKRLSVWCGSGILCFVCRFLDVLFRYYPDLIIVSRDFEIIGDVTSGMIPWFGTLVVAMSVLFILNSYLTASAVKDEVEIRL